MSYIKTVDIAREVDIPNARIDMGHPQRPGPISQKPHLHVGKTRHIPVIPDEAGEKIGPE
jgi:hypothetical protein